MKLSRYLILSLATGMGIGYSPFVPGTLGSVWGVFLCLIAFQSKLPIGVYLLCTLGLFLIGVPICHRAAVLMKTKDPGAVVWDEIAAMPIVFLPLMCLGDNQVSTPQLILGFLLFRLFDITKPWPIRRVEHLPRGWGIMTDDTIAACYAALVLLLTVTVWPAGS